MTDLSTYYDESYPPSVLRPRNPSTGAAAGIPGSWNPAGSTPPRNPAELSQGNPVTVTASPATAWTTGQYVQTQTAGVAGRATWTGSTWVSGAAPLETEPSSTETTETTERFEAIPMTNSPEEPNPVIPPDNPPEPEEPTPEQPA
jgi:hypothetical protein